jgi:hypothetical protein
LSIQKESLLLQCETVHKNKFYSLSKFIIMKTSKIALLAKVAQSNGMKTEDLALILDQLKQVESEAKESAKTEKEIKKAQNESEKAERQKIRAINVLSNESKKDVRKKAIEQHFSIGQIVTSIRKVAAKNSDLGKVLEKDFFALNMVNAYLSASEIKAVIKARGKYSVNMVVAALYRLRVDMELNALKGKEIDRSEAITKGAILLPTIQKYVETFEALQAQKLKDAKNVKTVVSQFEAKEISEADHNERLTKYMTSEKMNFLLSVELGKCLHDVFRVIQPNITNAQFTTLVEIYPDINFLDKLVNNKAKLKIENDAKQLQEQSNVESEVESVLNK